MFLGKVKHTSCGVLETKRLFALLEVVAMTEGALCLAGQALLTVVRRLRSERIGASIILVHESSAKSRCGLTGASYAYARQPMSPQQVRDRADVQPE